MENHADKIVSNGQAAAHIVHGSVASSGLPAMDAHHPYCHAGVNETVGPLLLVKAPSSISTFLL